MRWSHIRDNHVYIDSVNSKNNNNNSSMWNCPAIFGSENHTYQFGKSPTKRSSQSHTALKDMSMHNLNYLWYKKLQKDWQQFCYYSSRLLLSIFLGTPVWSRLSLKTAISRHLSIMSLSAEGRGVNLPGQLIEAGKNIEKTVYSEWNGLNSWFSVISWPCKFETSASAGWYVWRCVRGRQGVRI